MSLVVYAILYMLLALLYVLGTYAFVSLLLYTMHLESPPERVDLGKHYTDYTDYTEHKDSRMTNTEREGLKK